MENGFRATCFAEQNDFAELYAEAALNNKFHLYFVSALIESKKPSKLIDSFLAGLIRRRLNIGHAEPRGRTIFYSRPDPTFAGKHFSFRVTPRNWLTVIFSLSLHFPFVFLSIMENVINTYRRLRILSR